MGTQNVTYNTSTTLSNGKQTGVLLLGNFSTAPSSGATYNIQVAIDYTDTGTGFNYTDSGTVTGKVS